MLWLMVVSKARVLLLPKHIWFGVVIPVVLVVCGTWRLWPLIEKYRGEEEREVSANLILIGVDAYGHTIKLNGYFCNFYLWSGDVAELAHAVSELPGLRLRGLMCLPAIRQDFMEQRQPFAKMRKLKASLEESGISLDTLSMGMTADYRAAIHEGATLVRIGTALFGARD